jgi:urease accessory protein
MIPIESPNTPAKTERLRGRLELAFHCSAQSGQTSLRVIDQQPPLRVIRSFAQPDGSALVHLHNISGGVLGGDHLALRVRVGPGAQAQLTTIGATRIYRHRADRPDALQVNEFEVAENGLLEYLPDPVIPFAHSRFRQSTCIRLASGAGLFWWEIITPGRTAGQECFAYDHLLMDTHIESGGRPIAIEKMRLQPTHQNPASLVRLGPYRYLTTFYMCRRGASAEVWTNLEAELAELGHQRSVGGEVVWAVSALVRDGLVVRGVSQSSEPLSRGLLLFWQQAKAALYDGAVSRPPRKVY